MRAWRRATSRSCATRSRPASSYIIWRARGLPGLTRADAVRVVAAGLLVVVGYHMFLNVGTRYTTSGIAALVVALAPGLTMLMASRWGSIASAPAARRRARASRSPASPSSSPSVPGATCRSRAPRDPLIVLGAPLAFALYNVLLKPLLGRYDLLALTAATSLVGSVGFAPFARGSTVDTVVDASAGAAARLLYLGLLATLLGYILWNVGLRGLGPTRAVSYTYAISPLAVAFGAIFLGEPVTLWLALGGALVVGGIAAAQGVQLSGRLVSFRPWRSARSPGAS